MLCKLQLWLTSLVKKRLLGLKLVSRLVQFVKRTNKTSSDSNTFEHKRAGKFEEQWSERQIPVKYYFSCSQRRS